MKYRLNDLWNADKFGLIYKSTIKSTIGSGRIPWKKKIKHRSTFLAGANGDGTEKLPLLIIGNSHKPHRCKGKTG